jgi:hypothetical protein
MQCVNAVAAVKAARGGVKALRSQSQPEEKVCSRTEEDSLLFHDAEAARKSGTLPSRQ